MPDLVHGGCQLTECCGSILGLCLEVQGLRPLLCRQQATCCCSLQGASAISWPRSQWPSSRRATTGSHIGCCATTWCDSCIGRCRTYVRDVHLKPHTHACLDALRGLHDRQHTVRLLQLLHQLPEAPVVMKLQCTRLGAVKEHELDGSVRNASQAHRVKCSELSCTMQRASEEAVYM